MVGDWLTAECSPASDSTRAWTTRPPKSSES